jgi:hypothetical protein
MRWWCTSSWARTAFVRFCFKGHMTCRGMGLGSAGSFAFAAWPAFTAAVACLLCSPYLVPRVACMAFKPALVNTHG